MPKKKAQSAGIIRPPIVTILGHVDHGKTTLLDTIRHTRVALGEHGGITQHIGAYQADYQGKKITFIDTPGHAAFSQMRERGANVTDVVVLVIAGTEGVKPQTVESIKHIKKAGVPFVVALNKQDLPEFSADKVKSQLTKYEVFCEGFGGQVPAVNISAQKNEGIDQLLEIILLLADLEGIRTSSTNPLNAVIIESHLDVHRGHLATVVVKDGTLKSGSTIFLGEKPVKIKALFNDLNKPVREASPGDPVEVMGFTFLPQVGSRLTSTAVTVVPDTPITPPKPLVTIPLTETESATTEAEDTEPPPTVNVIIKADTAGTLEAIIDSVKQAELAIIAQAVGSVNEADIILAHNTGSGIIAFNVPIGQGAKNLAKIEHVKIQTFTIIYELIEFLEKKILSLLEPSIFEETLGTAKIVQVFQIRGNHIAGWQVDSGRLNVKDLIHLERNAAVVGHSKITSLKSGQVDVKAVKASESGGVVLDPNLDFQVGDVIKSYRLVERA